MSKISSVAEAQRHDVDDLRGAIQWLLSSADAARRERGFARMELWGKGMAALQLARKTGAKAVIPAEPKQLKRPKRPAISQDDIEKFQGVGPDPPILPNAALATIERLASRIRVPGEDLEVWSFQLRKAARTVSGYAQEPPNNEAFPGEAMGHLRACDADLAADSRKQTVASSLERVIPPEAPNYEAMADDHDKQAIVVPTPSVHSTRFHGPDYRDCTWNGERHQFTPTQAACVKVLWDASQNNTPELGEQTVLEMAGSESSKLRDVFKSGKKIHPVWGTMIVSGKTKGTFRLSARQ